MTGLRLPSISAGRRYSLFKGRREDGLPKIKSGPALLLALFLAACVSCTCVRAMQFSTGCDSVVHCITAQRSSESQINRLQCVTSEHRMLFGPIGKKKQEGKRRKNMCSSYETSQESVCSQTLSRALISKLKGEDSNLGRRGWRGLVHFFLLPQSASSTVE